MHCLGCGKGTLNLKYCGLECQHLHQDVMKRQRLQNGEYVGECLTFRTGGWARRFLIELFGYKCNACKISEWNGKPITLEVNHKDGNAHNNVLINLEFLCPNCHSQTSNFRALNKKSVRTHRKPH